MVKNSADIFSRFDANLTSSLFLHCIVCVPEIVKVLWMHSRVAGGNVEWCHLVWSTRYIDVY